MESKMKRGDIYFANLDPTIGNEIRKMRPVIIVSNNIANNQNKLLTVVPLTSNVSKVFPFEVFFAKKDSKLTKDSKAQAHQIRTISIHRICSKKLGNIHAELQHQLDLAIKLHLSLE